jgi:hypothetical protein
MCTQITGPGRHELVELIQKPWKNISCPVMSKYLSGVPLSMPQDEPNNQEYQT